jgi:asparagine synthase (glutamine-hydrolysing)
MSRDLAPLVREVVNEGVLVSSGFLRREALQRLVAEDASGQQDRAKHLWHVLSLEYWYRSAIAAGAGDVRAA